MPFRLELKERRTYALVVEDEVDMRMMLMLVLQREGLHVAGAANGLEAMKLLIDPAMHADATLPGIIFLDWEMPMMNGKEFLAAMSMMGPEVRQIPVVLTTAHKVDAPPNVELLRKPYTLDQLMQVINNHLSVEHVPATPSQTVIRVTKKQTGSDS